MKVEITPQTQAVIRQLMATGRYASEAAALEAALDERVDPHTGLTVRELRPMLQAGLDELRNGKGISSADVSRTLEKRFPDGS